jgi:hypothetical protein
MSPERIRSHSDPRTRPNISDSSVHPLSLIAVGLMLSGGRSANISRRKETSSLRATITTGSSVATVGFSFVSADGFFPVVKHIKVWAVSDCKRVAAG